MRSDPDLEALVDALLDAVEALRPLRAPPIHRSVLEDSRLRENVLLSLRLKVLPELRAPGGRPIFVGVQGGTNVGKSTVFNALAGQLLSPAVVQASSTKHPLIFAHERWRARLLDPGSFPGLEVRELEDPKELIVDHTGTRLLYFRFHSDDTLSDWALIDSPDFDSALETNRHVARFVTVLSDLTVFVTTDQKYKDRELVEHLRLLEELKASVVIVFNLLDEDIVFNTLLDDLVSTVPLSRDGLVAIRVPRSLSSHPESDIGDIIAPPLREHLASLGAAEVKPLLVRRTIGKTLEQVAALTALFAADLDLKTRFSRFLKKELREAVAAYGKSFHLALPEETLAIRKILRETELWPLVELKNDVETSSAPLRAITRGLRRVSETLRQILLRISRSHEGTIDETPAAAREYAEARNEADFEQIWRHALRLRQELETFFRDCEKTSPLAREVLEEYFRPEGTREFPSRLRERFDEEVLNRRERGEDIFERVDGWLEKHPLRRKLLRMAALTFKLFTGGLIAYVFPPRGWTDFLNWLEFAAGYLLGAYGIALAISLVVRRKKRFRNARVEGARATLEAALTTPLAELVDTILEEDGLRRIDDAAATLRKRRETPELTGASS